MNAPLIRHEFLVIYEGGGALLFINGRGLSLSAYPVIAARSEEVQRLVSYCFRQL